MLRRNRLYIPGNTPHLIEEVGVYQADVVIIDLEDSVPEEQKFDARILTKYSLKNVDFAGAERWVRINGIDTPHWKDDLREVSEFADVINLPKVECARDVAKILEFMGEDRRQIVPIIESLKGVLNSDEIARSDGVIAIAWGGEDITKEMGIPREEALILDYIRSKLIISAKANHRQALDTVYSDFKDIDGLSKYTKRARYMGFDGVGCIHPNQIEVVNQAFMPSESEMDNAKKIVESYKGGATSLNGKMIDKPVMERAKKILELGEVHVE